MHHRIKTSGMEYDEYMHALMVDEDLIGTLDSAHSLVEEALLFVDEHKVDNPEQLAYAKVQIDSLRYLAERIMRKLEGKNED